MTASTYLVRLIPCTEYLYLDGSTLSLERHTGGLNLTYDTPLEDISVPANTGAGPADLDPMMSI